MTDHSPSELEQLGEKFHWRHVKQRKAGFGNKKLDYIDISTTIRRLNKVLGSNWSFVGSGTKTGHILIQNKSGEPEEQYYAVVEGHIEATVDGKHTQHYGVGGASGKDLDDVVKTALAEALKKAGHQLEIGLYLWNEEDREEVDLHRKADTGDITAIKTLLYQRAVREGADDLTPQGIASHYGLSLEELRDEEKLKTLIES